MDIGIPLGSMAGAPSVIRQNIRVPVVVLAVPSGILAFLACLALLVHLDFDLDGSGGPLWQVVFFHLTMGLLLLGAVLVGWKSLPFVGGRWCLLPALLVFPLLLGIYLVEWHWAGSRFHLEEPRDAPSLCVCICPFPHVLGRPGDAPGTGLPVLCGCLTSGLVLVLPAPRLIPSAFVPVELAAGPLMPPAQSAWVSFSSPSTSASHSGGHGNIRACFSMKYLSLVWVGLLSGRVHSCQTAWL